MYLSPYVPTDNQVVDEMLKMLKLRPNEILYDIGSGKDARILSVAAVEYGTRGVGIEIQPSLCEISKVLIKDLGLEDRIKIIEGDVMNNKIDLSNADAVTMYLTSNGVNMVKYKLENQLHPNCRVLSENYPIHDWKASEVKKFPGRVTLYFYLMGSI